MKQISMHYFRIFPQNHTIFQTNLLLFLNTQNHRFLSEDFYIYASNNVYMWFSLLQSHLLLKKLYHLIVPAFFQTWIFGSVVYSA